MSPSKLILDHVYDHVAAHPDRIFLTQPLGGDQIADYSWAEVLDQARRMAAVLHARGLQPGDKVAILSKNCAHFFIAELAIWLGGYTTVAIFPTETAETINYVLLHSEARLLFVGKLDTWEHQRPGVPEDLPCIALPLAPAAAIKAMESWDDLASAAKPLAGRVQRGPDDLAMLIYTSGSTGTPKGAMVSFKAISAAAEGIVSDTRKRIGNQPGRMLSYLPLAHSFERSWVEAMSFVDGDTRIYFAESLDTFLQDLQRARPTMFVSVPRLWLKFQQGVFAKMPPAKLDRLMRIPILGGIVKRKVVEGLGLDAVVQAGSGSAPIPPDLIAWYRKLGLKLFEGYGMTEDNSYSHSSNDQFSEPGYVGVPMPGVEVRLNPEGEVLIRSPGAFSGYFKQPELTAECFTEDGFFRTGDLGERRTDGMLKITGRAKELFKTAKGKYIAPAPIENQINAHAAVEMSLVSGVGQPAAYAMIVLAEDLRPKVKSPAVRQQVEADLTQLLREVNAKLPDYSKLQFFIVVPEPWNIEDGTLTPTMKIRRSRIEAKVQPQVEAWYADKAKVQWA